jgi:hypothetical protein
VKTSDEPEHKKPLERRKEKDGAKEHPKAG